MGKKTESDKNKTLCYSVSFMWAIITYWWQKKVGARVYFISLSVSQADISRVFEEFCINLSSAFRKVTFLCSSSRRCKIVWQKLFCWLAVATWLQLCQSTQIKEARFSPEAWGCVAAIWISTQLPVSDVKNPSWFSVLRCLFVELM